MQLDLYQICIYSCSSLYHAYTELDEAHRRSRYSALQRIWLMYPVRWLEENETDGRRFRNHLEWPLSHPKIVADKIKQWSIKWNTSDDGEDAMDTSSADNNANNASMVTNDTLSHQYQQRLEPVQQEQLNRRSSQRHSTYMTADEFTARIGASRPPTAHRLKASSEQQLHELTDAVAI